MGMATTNRGWSKKRMSCQQRATMGRVEGRRQFGMEKPWAILADASTGSECPQGAYFAFSSAAFVAKVLGTSGCFGQREKSLKKCQSSVDITSECDTFIHR